MIRCYHLQNTQTILIKIKPLSSSHEQLIPDFNHALKQSRKLILFKAEIPNQLLSIQPRSDTTVGFSMQPNMLGQQNNTRNT